MREVEIARPICYAGLDEMSPDDHAIVGRSVECENLWLANGSSGHGVMHSPALGRIVADLIVGNTHAGAENPQIFEVTRDKKVVWQVKDWNNFGNDLCAQQVLDVPGKPLR